MHLPFSWITLKHLCLWITCVSLRRTSEVRNVPAVIPNTWACRWLSVISPGLRANEVAEMRIIGDVEGLDVLLIDDMVDTAGTITKAANLMLENGAKSVRAIASHAVMSDPASTRVDQSALTEMIFTDSIPYAKKCEKVKVLSVADMFAEAIRRVCSGESISSLYAI